MTWIPRAGILLPFSIAALIRGVTLTFPQLQNDYEMSTIEPPPLMFNAVAAPPPLFSILWILSGLSLLVFTFVGHKLVLKQGYVAQIRADDAAILLLCFLYLLWGLSYFVHWLYSVFVLHVYSADLIFAKNYLPVAIAGFCGWLSWFMIRTESEVQRRSSLDSLHH